MLLAFNSVSKISFFIKIVAIISLVNGCSAVVGAGATVGVAAVQERGVKGRANDLRIEAILLKKFVSSGLQLTTSIGAEIYDGRVLLTGATEDVKLSDAAVKLSWQVDGVKDVINEIQLGSATTFQGLAIDSWITANLKSKIMFDENILAINYSIETVNRTVYLIGIAQNKDELQRVIAHANGVGRIKKVISHVQFKKRPFEQK